MFQTPPRTGKARIESVRRQAETIAVIGRSPIIDLTNKEIEERLKSLSQARTDSHTSPEVQRVFDQVSPMQAPAGPTVLIKWKQDQEGRHKALVQTISDKPYGAPYGQVGDAWDETAANIGLVGKLTTGRSLQTFIRTGCKDHLAKMKKSENASGIAEVLTCTGMQY
jgi:hypothetical protein